MESGRATRVVPAIEGVLLILDLTFFPCPFPPPLPPPLPFGNPILDAAAGDGDGDDGLCGVLREFEFEFEFEFEGERSG